MRSYKSGKQAFARYPLHTHTSAAVFLLIFFPAMFFSACSTPPKKPTEIFTERNIGASQLNLANQIANGGRYDEALLLLAEARRIAISTDDPQLRIKTSTSRGNILFSMGRRTEAFTEIESAAAEGEASGEKVLASLARIYAIRFNVRVQEESGKKDSGDFIDRLNKEMAIVKSDPSALAAAYVTLGMTQKLSGRWTEAESSVKKALDIHTKGFFLEDAAYDWFLIASIRSVAGNYDSSIEALKQAIIYDRRAENGFGLASSWQAMGDVYKKAGRLEESRSAYRRAVEIFRAINFNDQAERLERQIGA